PAHIPRAIHHAGRIHIGHIEHRVHVIHMGYVRHEVYEIHVQRHAYRVHVADVPHLLGKLGHSPGLHARDQIHEVHVEHHVCGVHVSVTYGIGQRHRGYGARRIHEGCVGDSAHRVHRSVDPNGCRGDHELIREPVTCPQRHEVERV